MGGSWGKVLVDDWIRTIEDRLFSAPDTVCLERAQLVTEAAKRFADQPVPVARARAFQHVLSHMPLDLTSNPVFAGNTSSRACSRRAWPRPMHGTAAS